MRLVQAIAELGNPRVMVFIVSDGVSDDDWPENPIHEIMSDQWHDYEVDEVTRRGSHSILYSSAEAETMYPEQRNVRIRVEFLHMRSHP